MDTIQSKIEIETEARAFNTKSHFKETEIHLLESELTPPSITEETQWSVNTELPVSFLIKYSNDILNPLSTDLLSHGSQGIGSRRLVVVDSNVVNLYGDRIENYFKANKINFEMISVESTEVKKDLSTLLEILESMEKFNILRRNEPLIAIGGGVLLDIAGMAASMFRRGIPYIRVPTTLLGLVDASVGAKVAVNHFDRRNRLGAYYPPCACYLDTSFLKTVSNEDISNGLAEIIKMAVIKDENLFNLVEKCGARLIIEKFQIGKEPEEIINRSIQGMVEELEPNLWEKDLERVVDFGHSFSPLIEMSALPELSHGQAVVLDILFSCIISENRGHLSSKNLERIFLTIKKCGLPTYHPMFTDVEMLNNSLSDTIKHRNGNQNLPIPVDIGRCIFVNDLSKDEIAKAAERMKCFNI